MEQSPKGTEAEQRLLRDISNYCGFVHEANGSYEGTILAVADFLVSQFHLTQADATKFIQTSGYFSKQDAEAVIYEKAALAPLLLTDDLAEMQVIIQVGLGGGDQIESIDNWYSKLSSIALGISAPHGHSAELCCSDPAIESLLYDEMGCDISDTCAFRATRRFLLDAALQPNIAAITNDSDVLLKHIIMQAKLLAAVDHDFITYAQKEVIDARYTERVEKGDKQ